MGEDEEDGLRTDDEDEDFKHNRVHTTALQKNPGSCNKTASSTVDGPSLSTSQISMKEGIKTFGNDS
jgi:hypothetical protein